MLILFVVFYLIKIIMLHKYWNSGQSFEHKVSIKALENIKTE